MPSTIKIQTWFHKVVLAAATLTFLLVLPRHTTAMRYINNDKTEKRFIWKIKGIDAYASPDLNSTPMDILAYGDEVDVLETLPDKTEEISLRHSFEHQVDGYRHVHTPKWLKIDYENRVLYVLDTYLLEIEPPSDDSTAAFVFEHYMENLSPIVSSNQQGKTPEFCERQTFQYENGMRYTMTDFGPCEQCGHS